MTTVKEHIDILQKLARDGVPTQELGLLYYHLFNTHLAGDKGDHLVDPTGYTISIEEFFQKLETPEPEPIFFKRKGETPQGTKPIQGLRDPEPRRKA